jgi:hypothetical protein
MTAQETHLYPSIWGLLWIPLPQERARNDPKLELSANCEGGPYITREGGRQRLRSRGERPGLVEMVCARGNDLAFSDSLGCSLTEQMAEEEMCIRRRGVPGKPE